MTVPFYWLEAQQGGLDQLSSPSTMADSIIHPLVGNSTDPMGNSGVTDLLGALSQVVSVCMFMLLKTCAHLTAVNQRRIFANAEWSRACFADHHDAAGVR